MGNERVTKSDDRLAQRTDAAVIEIGDGEDGRAGGMAKNKQQNQ